MPVSGASLHFDLYRDAVNPGANPSGNYTGPWRDKITAADGAAWTGTFAAADGDASLDSLRFAGGTTLSKATGALTIDWENGTEARIRSELTWNAIKNIALDQFDGTKLTDLAPYGVVPGQHWAADDDDSIIFQSTRGACRALPFKNLHERSVSFAPGLAAGGAIRRSGGQRHYLVAIQQGGSAFNQN